MDLISEQRLARRAAILETAREMIAEMGYEAVTVRDLAQRCRVSVPTLYNQFGDKDGLLGAAIEAHFMGVLDGAPLAAAEPGFDRLMVIVDQCAEQLLTLSTYHQRLLEAFMSLTNTIALQQRIALRLTNFMRRELQTMASRRQLADWAVRALVAEQMTAACINAAVIWSSGLFTDDHLRPTMRFATGLVMLGVTRGKTRARLQARIEEAQAHLLQVRSDHPEIANESTQETCHG
jgi:AcrR family transcriptional regulator